MASELQVNTITEATSGSGITFAKDIIPATPLSHRNLIINGAMQVHQRVATNTLVQAVNASNTTGWTVDRFKFWENTDGTYQTKHNTVTDLAGFTSSLYLSPNGADTNIDSGQYAFFAQLIEAQNLQHLAYGTANAKTMILSFYIKSNLTGKMTAYVAKYDNTVRIVPLEFDLPSSAGTWERITLTVPALTETAAGVINNDNGMGLEIGWYMTAGGTYKVGTSGTWGSNSNGYSTTNHNINFMSHTSNYIEITGVQLELGSVATPFEHRSYGEELARCERYCQKIGLITPTKSREIDRARATDVHFKTTMRANCTVPSIQTTDNVTLTISGQSPDGFHGYYTASSDGMAAAVPAGTIVTAEL